jgi:hypothetical protein
MAAMQVGGGATSPTTSVRPGTANSYNKRKRSNDASSPGSGGEEDDGGSAKRQPGVKRACNECRQQKVSHESRSRKKATRQECDK